MNQKQQLTHGCGKEQHKDSFILSELSEHWELQVIPFVVFLEVHLMTPIVLIGLDPHLFFPPCTSSLEIVFH